MATMQGRIVQGDRLGGEPLPADLSDRIVTDARLTRKIVSYQGNRKAPGLRWMRYKEGFSADLVRGLLEEAGAKRVLDPFSGMGTTVLTACSMGIESVGMDVMPVGNEAARAIIAVARDVDAASLRRAADRLVEYAASDGSESRPFPHVRITRGAFPAGTEAGLGRARAFTAGIADPALRAVLDFACMSVLEEVSYTSKDGQFLRWDRRSGRDVSDRLRKHVQDFVPALSARLAAIVADAGALRERYRGPRPVVRTVSSLTGLREMRDGSFDAVVTSPPYANRYDYTRTYALELAYMGYGEGEIRALRQDMLTATVENKPKGGAISAAYGGGSALPARAAGMAAGCGRLQEVLARLRGDIKSLNNPQIVRLVENYFAEMALVIAELGRLVGPGGSAFMVNDNVRYHGTDVPVDLILSEFAEQSGFRCESIRALKRGKGNASQQMGRFGRREMRKCVYHWRRP